MSRFAVRPTGTAPTGDERSTAIHRLGLVILAMTTTLAPACDAPTRPQLMCAYFDECGFPDTWDEPSCNRDVDAFVRTLAGTARDRWETQMDRCLDIEACSPFIDCCLEAIEQ